MFQQNAERFATRVGDTVGSFYICPMASSLDI